MTNGIAIFAAMENEIRTLWTNEISLTGLWGKANSSFDNRLLEHSVWGFKTGVGKVNAAMISAQVLNMYPGETVDKRGFKWVFITGVAGGIDPSLKVGDVVISTSALQHDVDVTALNLGLKRGEIPFEEASEWQANQELTNAAKRASDKLEINPHLGRIVSGDQFVAKKEKKLELYERFKASAADMETAAIAQVCSKMKYPWVAIRVISDTADEQSPTDFEQFVDSAATKAAEIIIQTIKIIDPKAC